MTVEAEVIEEREKDSTMKKEYADKGYLQIPIEAKDFKDFVLKLLGKPEILAGGYIGAYEISKETITDFTELFDQRMYQQNNATLTNFSCKLFFSDRTTRDITSYESFLGFREGKDVICTRVDVSWIYLIKFSDKESPEKQEITIKFRTKELEFEEIDLPSFLNRNLIEYEIRHTARTWGLDIETLIEKKIKELMIKENKYFKWIKRNNWKIGLFIGVLLFVVLSSILCYVLGRLSSEVFQNYSKVLGIEKKLDLISMFLLNQNIYNSNFKSLLMFFFILVFSVVMGTMLTSQLGFEKQSFLLFTTASEKNKDRIKKKENHKVFKIIFTLILGIISSLLATYIFEYFLR